MSYPVQTISIQQAFELAATHHRCGNLAAAESMCWQILGAQPNRPDTLHLMGLIAAGRGQNEDALKWFSTAAERAPERAIYHSDRAVMLRLLGGSEDAIAALERAVVLNPSDAIAWSNLCDSYQRIGKIDEALRCGQRAVGVRPDLTGARNNFGNALRKAGRIEEAIAQFNAALAQDSASAAAHNNLANAFMVIDHWDEAALECRKAIAIAPRFAAAHLNLGVTQIQRLEIQGAEASFSEAIAIDPNFADAHWNRAIACFLSGKFESGWREYEWRLLRPETSIPDRNLPRWDGARIEGKTLLVRFEQGLGDSLQFMRYLPLVHDRSVTRVVVECPPALARLLGDNGIETVTKREPVYADCEIPLMSLPLALGRYEPLEMDHPYLRATKGAGLDSAGLRVGLVWAGNPQHVEDRRRSIAAGALGPILSGQGVTFYSLQLGQAAPAGVTDLTPRITDFSDTAALMAELDLIITVDTAAAHLAGALGRPVWTLLPFVPDWRWGLEREDTPWYPTMRLFRQRRAGDWGEVIERVAGELVRLVG